MSNSTNVTLSGGLGNDTFNTTASTSNVLNGGEGDDLFKMFSDTKTTANGGDGNDTFILSSANNNTVSGGAGNDAITMAALNAASNGGGLGATRISGHDWSVDTLSLQGFWTTGQIDATNLALFVKITKTNDLQLDMDGAGAKYTWTTIANMSLQTNFTDVATLYANASLIISA
jgi:hypothetical protein